MWKLCRSPFLALSLLLISGAKSWDLREPPSTDIADIDFLLWSRQNPVDEDVLIFGDSISIDNSHFNASRPTKVLVHGYTDNGRTGWVRQVRDEFLFKEDCNVISVDWELLAGPSPYYPEAVANVPQAGYHVGDFVQFLIDNHGAPLASFHPIGFSLGGQLVGLMGQRLNGQLTRITGLDPAGPFFHTVNDSDRLSRDDALFVDVIHSAGLWIGMDEIVGHVDFYPNGGEAHQPGCDDENIGISCSHHRAPDFLAESINSPIGFEAMKCSSYQDFLNGTCIDPQDRNFMGLPADPNNPGVFYLTTNQVPPFAQILP